jgi:uncharacterized protein (DUF697 family)
MTPAARDLVNTHATACAGIAAAGTWVPLLDKFGIGTSWTAMILGLAEEYGLEMERSYAKKVVASMATGALFYIVGSEVLSTILTFTGLGALPAAAVNAVLTYIYTQRLGNFVSHQFDVEGWDWHRSAWTFGKLALDHVKVMPTGDEFSDAADVLGYDRFRRSVA